MDKILASAMHRYHISYFPNWSTTCPISNWKSKTNNLTKGIKHWVLKWSTNVLELPVSNWNPFFLFRPEIACFNLGPSNCRNWQMHTKWLNFFPLYRHDFIKKFIKYQKLHYWVLTWPKMFNFGPKCGFQSHKVKSELTLKLP